MDRWLYQLLFFRCEDNIMIIIKESLLFRLITEILMYNIMWWLGIVLKYAGVGGVVSDVAGPGLAVALWWGWWSMHGSLRYKSTFIYVWNILL